MRSVDSFSRRSERKLDRAPIDAIKFAIAASARSGSAARDTSWNSLGASAYKSLRRFGDAEHAVGRREEASDVRNSPGDYESRAAVDATAPALLDAILARGTESPDQAPSVLPQGRETRSEIFDERHQCVYLKRNGSERLHPFGGQGLWGGWEFRARQSPGSQGPGPESLGWSGARKGSGVRRPASEFFETWGF